MPFPYRHPTTGRTCCSNPAHLCPACEARRAEEAAGVRLHLSSAAPPDPYAAGLKALQAALPSTRWPDMRTASSTIVTTNGVPDGYATALARLRGAK